MIVIAIAGLMIASGFWETAWAAPARPVPCRCDRQAATVRSVARSAAVGSRSDPGGALKSRRGGAMLDPPAKSEGRRWVETPARYEVRTTRTLEAPAGWTFRREVTVDSGGARVETLCREWRAARYRSSTRRVMVAPAGGRWSGERLQARAADPAPPPECRRKISPAPTAAALRRAWEPTRRSKAAGRWLTIHCPPRRIVARAAPAPRLVKSVGRPRVVTAVSAPGAKIKPPPLRVVTASAGRPPPNAGDWRRSTPH